MFLKGALKNSSAFIQLIVFLTVISAGMIGASLLGQLLIIIKYGLSPEIIEQVMKNIINYPDLLRNMQFLQVIGVFILPAIICAWLFSDNYKNYLKVDTVINIPIIGLIILSIFIFVPFINWIHVLNQQIVFPEWLKGIEEWMLNLEETNATLKEKLLYSETIWILIFNILIICVLTGIGEEFVFRGVVQNILGKTIKNPHVIIWIAAIIFSALHLQFFGFFPRLLLGAYFGYLLWYTKSMWMPVIAHFTHNLFSVLTFYIFQDTPEIVNEIDWIGSIWWLGIISLGLFLILFMHIKRLAALQNPSS